VGSVTKVFRKIPLLCKFQIAVLAGVVVPVAMVRLPGVVMLVICACAVAPPRRTAKKPISDASPRRAKGEREKIT
jgi:hypothetical protein